jgi:hypothetical protein
MGCIAVFYFNAHNFTHKYHTWLDLFTDIQHNIKLSHTQTCYAKEHISTKCKFY